MKNIYEKYAKLLVNYSLELKKGDKFLVRSSYLAEDLLKEVYREALEVGAHPELLIELDGTEKIFYEAAGQEQLKYISPMFKYMIENYEAYLVVLAPFNLKELQNVDPLKKQSANMAKIDLTKTHLKRMAEGSLKWSACMFPTDAAAQECGMSRGEYEKFVYSACFLYDEDPMAKWLELRDKQQEIVDYLNGKEQVRYVGKDIDITFSTQGRKWFNSAGTTNMPSGEVFTSPVEDSVNGKIVSNWQLQDGTFSLNVIIPVNTTATVYIPAESAKSVTESGRRATGAKGVKFLHMKQGTAVFTIGSGNYQFESKVP